MTGILNALIAGVSGAVKDTYFNLVSLLLPGNGTDGKQNRTFKDSSVNDFLITPNGNATQGTFSPFSQTGWGASFSGSNQLTIPSALALAPEAGQFCIEFWIYPTASWGSVDRPIFVAAGSGGLWVGWQSTAFVLRAYGVTNHLSYATAPTLNKWTHVAICRNSGNTTSMYFDGSRVATGTVTQNFAQAIAYIGSDGAYGAGGAALLMASNLSNLRLVKGSSVYDPTLTSIPVPTSPLTAITNTTLLICQSNRFVDNASTPNTITSNGSVTVTPFSPFAPTQSYLASAVGGSGYFDGTGDYLDLPSNANLATSSSDFTLECWVYLNSTAGSYIFSGTGATIQITGGSIITYDGSNHTIGTPIANQWCHIAICRSGSTIKAYYNGTESTSWTNSGTQYTHSGARIGAAISTGSTPINGYITNYRLIVGTALYTTSTITVPTAPLTAVSGTSLLLNFTNAGVVDATAKNVLETVGNAQISTTQSKWGGGSMSFDGSGDWLSSPASPIWIMSGDWTLEGWIYPNSVTGVQVLIDTRNRVSGASSPVFYLNGTSLVIDTGAGAVISAGTISLGSSGGWQHIAATRSGNSWRLFINGSQVGSTTTNTTSFTTAYGCTLGSSFTNEYYNGYMDDVRVTKYARYTGSTYTVPTAPFPVQ